MSPEEFAVFAGILPEGKYNLVKAFQKSGHIVGMCGDGANDAPALRQAQMGIAVSTATDVAKSAAGIVLTKPGLGGIVASIKEGRVTFQRILTYTLNSVTKKVVQVLFLALGLVMTGHAILTPMLMVIIMLTGDLLGMSMTTDNVRPSPTPNAWRIGALTMAGVFMGISELIFCAAVLATAKFRLDLGFEATENRGFRSHRLRQSGDDLYESRTSTDCVLPSKPVAGRIVCGRCADCIDAGDFRNWHVSRACGICGRNARGSSGFCIRSGFCKSPGVHAPRKVMTATRSRQRMDYGHHRQTSLRRGRDSRRFVPEPGYNERPMDSGRDYPRFEHGVH